MFSKHHDDILQTTGQGKLSYYSFSSIIKHGYGQGKAMVWFIPENKINLTSLFTLTKTIISP